jgi:hypothetical protein
VLLCFRQLRSRVVVLVHANKVWIINTVYYLDLLKDNEKNEKRKKKKVKRKMNERKKKEINVKNKCI